MIIENDQRPESPSPPDPDRADDILDRINIYPFMIGIALFLAALIVPYRDIHIPREMMIAAGGISLVFFALISLESHYLTLLILAVYLPFSKSLAGDFGNIMVGFNLTNILSALIIAGWIARAAFHRQRFFLHSAADLPIFLFSFLAVLSLIRGGIATAGLSPELVVTLKRYLTPLFLFYIFSSNVRTAKQARAVIICTAAVVGIVVLMGLKEFYIDIGGVGRLNSIRIKGICQQSNNIGAFYTYYTLVPLCLYLCIPRERREWIHTLAIPWSVIAFWTMSRSFSRGSMLSFGATLGFLLFYHDWRGALKFFLPIMLLVLMIPGIVPYSIIGRFTYIKASGERTFEESLDDSSEARLHHWKGALRMIRAHPFIGIGYGLYQQKAQDFSYYDYKGTRDAHHGLLLIGAEMGLPALGFFLLIMTIFFFTGRNIYRRSEDDFFRGFGLFIMTMCAAVFASNFFGDRLSSQELSSYYWVLGGVAMVVKRLMDQGQIATVEPPSPPARPAWSRSMQEIRAAQAKRRAP